MTLKTLCIGRLAFCEQAPVHRQPHGPVLVFAGTQVMLPWKHSAGETGIKVFCEAMQLSRMQGVLQTQHMVLICPYAIIVLPYTLRRAVLLA